MTTYTREQLYAAILDYRVTFYGKSMDRRTFRRWRQQLEMIPDLNGLYWESDLEKLKKVVSGLARNETLNQVIRQIRQEEKNRCH